MNVSAVRKLTCTMFLALGSLVWVPTERLAAQNGGDIRQIDRRIEEMVGRSFDDFIWSDISVYQLRDHYLQRLISMMDAASDSDRAALERIGGNSETGSSPAFADMMIRIVQMPQASRGIEEIKKLVAQKYGIDPDDIDEPLLLDAVARARAIVQHRRNRPTEFYLVTSHAEFGETPRLIALIGTTREGANADQVIRMVKAGSDLYAFLGSEPADSGTSPK